MGGQAEWAIHGERGRRPMAMRSPINWALLGLVIDRPSYGYELALRFMRVYEGVLSISGESHIYSALDALESKGLVEETSGRGAVGPVSDRRRQPKRHYRSTAGSAEKFEEWLLAQTLQNRQHSQLFVRQMAVYPPDAALRVLDRYEQECLRDCAKALSASAGSVDGDGSNGLVERLTCEESRLASDARLAWVQFARRELKEIARSQASSR